MFFFNFEITTDAACEAPNHHRRWSPADATITLPSVFTRARSYPDTS